VSDVDVAIIGGGPAGCAAALTLLRYTRMRVAVIERSAYDRWRVGETLSPGVQPLLAYLDATSTLDAEGQLRNYGTAAAWGGSDVVSRDFLFVAAGEGWHLDRARFDRGLASLVRARGGDLRSECVVDEETHDGTMWSLALSDGTSMRAKFVIDCSGRHAAFARRRGARAELVDNLTGVVAIFAAASNAHGTLVEAVADGWWYSAQLPGERLVVALMTDADAIREQQFHDAGAWRAVLDATHATRARADGALMLQAPQVCPAQSQILQPLFGEAWAAAGEAAVAFDPLSSMGIGYALASGIQAARLAATAVNGHVPDGATYAEDVRNHFDAYLARRRDYYRVEQRWNDRPFWQRRQSV